MNITRLIVLAFLPIIMFSGFSGCILDPETVNEPVDKAVDVIDKGINDINTGSADWQTVLQRVAKDLPEGISENIRIDAQNLADRSVATAGVEFRCNSDFLNRRAVQSLENLKAELLGKDPTVLPPALCHVSPESVDLKTSSGSWSKIIYYGYDLDHKDSDGELFKIFAIDSQGNKISVPEERIGRTTHYQVTLNLGGSEMKKLLYEQKIQKLIFEWSGSTYSQGEVVIIPWESETQTVTVPISSTTYYPPKTVGDEDFDTDDENPMNVVLSAFMSMDSHSIGSQVYMKASEHDDDYTTVEGWSPVSTIYTAPKGWEIIDFQPSARSDFTGSITEHNQKTFWRPSGEVVSSFTVWGDRDDNEAGTWTRVEANWRELKVTLRQENPDWDI